MKKFFVTIILSAATAVLFAQVQDKTRLNAYGMYVFDDKFDSYYDPYNYYNGTLKGSFQYGAGLEFMVSPHNCIELMWQHQSTTAPTEYYNGQVGGLKHADFDVNIDYAMIGGDRHFAPPGSKAEGYGGLFLGMAFLGAKNTSGVNQSHNTASKFAWGFRLGTNIWASEKVGIKLQAQLLSISQGAGGGLYFGTGGVGAGVSSYSSVYQFQLGGGLTFKLGGHKK
jgi:hypothetical protein